MEDEVSTTDFHAIGEKHTLATEQTELLVIGAGEAGLAAALEAARTGVRVTLVDENPLGAGLIGMDVPLLFGNRWTAAVQNQGRMLEQILSTNPGLEEAFELGVDVKLGTYAWGAFVSGPNLRSLPGPVVGLADETRSWLCGFQRLIIASGARDLVYSFAGFETPGVIGALGFTSLLTRYEAFNGHRLVILGSGDLAVSTAHRALAAGLEVAALVEVRDAPQADVSDLIAKGVRIVTGHTILSATGTDGVSGAVLASVDGGAVQTVACDTIVLAIGTVPVVELADVAGAKIRRSEAGAYVPAIDSAPRGVFFAGDCTGAGQDAATSGRAAAHAALRSLGHDIPDVAPLTATPALPTDTDAYRMEWMRALMATGGLDVVACSCEDVTRGDLLTVQPPRYLEAPIAERDIGTLAQDGPVSQDQIKRLTRACMGPCQARRCREQVAMMLAIGSDVPLSSVALAGYRAPVRPLPLAVLAAFEETPEMAEGWNVWFGIRTQWVPYGDIGTEREIERAGRVAHF
ncbi:FAD-dependent oxidoreductase [Acidisoma cladoniae]|jgi:thioredoxin reductase|uniref:FAD-dependent oxidoreductase n=1 Tax=Acidisoma cladoniae TaxID=3040935 RepID=UPI00254F78CB|nr:FAD-dependent oxidoreductase [Acidisoma sp. PAMC 29798]